MKTRPKQFPRVMAFAALTLSAALGACAPVQPWQRGTLARPDMQLDAGPLQAAFDDHVYFSKEASSGGRGFGGGGCGCN